MSLFTPVSLYCNCCGRPILTKFSEYDGRFCDKICKKEYDIRRTTCIMGVEDPEKLLPFLREDDPTTKAKDALKEFFSLLNKQEVSDSDHLFSPNYISSCRVMDCIRLEEIFTLLHKWTGSDAINPCGSKVYLATQVPPLEEDQKDGDN